MEVSKELLEAAAHSMLQGTSPQQQEAVDFFEAWQSSSDVLITASRIFFSSLNENQNANSSDNGLSDSLQFIMCCVILDVSSSDAWYKYSSDSKEEIRQNIINVSYNFDHSRKVSEKLDQIVANIAFNEWPENWPDFLTTIQNYLETYIETKTNQSTFTESSMHVYRTLFYFLKLISGSTKITLKRRSQLLDIFISNLPNLCQSIFKECSLNMESNKLDLSYNNENEFLALESFLELTSQLFLIIQNNQEITSVLSQFLFETFIELPSSLVNNFRSELNPDMSQDIIEEIGKKILELEKIASLAFQDLSLLLSKSSYLEHLISPIISLFEAQVEKNTENEEAQCNRLNSSFCEFVCKLLMNIIKPIFDSNADSSANIIQIDTSNASQIEQLLNITLVYAPRDHFCEDFWILWNQILTKVTSTEENENIQQYLEIFRQMVTSLFSLALTTFYEILPCSTNLSRLSSSLTASSLDFLMKLGPQETTEFMTSQPPSLSLCFSLGILKSESLIPKLVESIEYFKNLLQTEMPDIPVISSILFALSRNSPLIMKTPAGNEPISEEQSQLIQILVDFFKTVSYSLLVESEDSDYQETLLLALNHISSHAPNVFTQDMEFVDILLNVATDPEKLGKDNFSRLCSIIAKVILTTPQELKDQYIERLTSIASVPLLSGDLEAIEIGTQAAYSISSIPILGLHYITRFLWKPLVAAMKTTSVVPDHFLFSDIVTVFSSSIRMAPYPLCKKYINQFMEISLQTLSTSQNENKETAEQPMSEPLNPTPSNFDDSNLSVSVLDAYNMLCQMYGDAVDDYRDLFANTFAQTMANNPTPCFFEFFKINGVKENEERIVVECACSSLSNPDSKITRAAASLLKKMISKRKDDQFIIYWQPKIIRSVFLSLFDELHSEPIVLLSIIQVIYAIYKRHIRNSSLSPVIDQIVVDAISEPVGDDTVSLHIAESMRCVANSKEEFMQLIKDFLGTYGRMNPVEMKMFDDSLSLLQPVTPTENQDSVSLFSSSNSSSEVVEIRSFSQVHY